MIMIFIRTTITKFWLKSETFGKKLSVMTNNTPGQTIRFGEINSFQHISPIIF